MTRRFFACGAFAAVMAAASIAAQRPPSPGGGDASRQPPVAGGAAIVRGTVTAADTGTVVRRAEVRASNDDGRIRTTTTDDEGRYELGDMTAGEWTLTASKTGFVDWRFGQKRPFEPVAPITLVAGERFAADIVIPRGGAISGRISDEFGDPLAAVKVSAFRARMAQGRRRLERVAVTDQTDDTGYFRIFALAPGEYYVAASLRVAPVESVVDTTYGPTYFPGTGNLAEAQRVSLGPGDNVTADFPVLPVRPARVSGIVLTSGGAPADALLNLTSEGAELGVPLGVGGATLPDGTFTLPDVPPGTYTLTASLRGAEGNETSTIPVTVSGDHVAALTLITARPARLRGTFTVDGTAAGTLPSGLAVRVHAVRAAGMFPRISEARNGFEISDLDGPFYLAVDGLPDAWAVKAILVNGADVTDSPIDLKSDQNAVAQVVLTDRSPAIIGAIVSSTPRAGHSVVVFPDDSSKWTYRSRYLRASAADETGRFRVGGLPAGNRYLAVAVDYLEDGEHTDPDFLARMKDHAVAVSLADGEQKRLDLPLVQR